MPLIQLGNNAEYISKNVQEADTMSGDLGESSFFRTLGGIFGEQRDEALSLQKKRDDFKRIQMANDAHSNLQNQYTIEKERLGTESAQKVLADRNGIIPLEYMDKSTGIQWDKYVSETDMKLGGLSYDAYLSVYYKALRERELERMDTNGVDEWTKNLFTNYTLDEEKTELINNIKTQAKLSSEGILNTQKDSLREISNDFINLPQQESISDHAVLQYDRTNKQWDSLAGIAPFESTAYRKNELEFIANTAIDYVESRLDQPQNAEAALEDASKMFGDTFKYDKKDGKLYMTGATYEELRQRGGENGDNFEQLMANIEQDLGVLSDNDFNKAVRQPTPNFMQHADPKRKKDLLDKIMRSFSKIKKEKDNDAKTRMKAYTDAFGNRDINKGTNRQDAFNGIRIILDNDPDKTTFSTVDRADVIFDISVNEAIREIVNNKLANPNRKYSMDKEVLKQIPYVLAKVAPTDKETQDIILKDKVYALGKVKTLQQDMVRAVEQSYKDAYAHPDAHFFANDSTYRGLETKIKDKGTPLTTKNLKEFFEYRDNLFRRFHIVSNDSRKLPREVKEAMAEKLQMQLALDLNNGTAGATIRMIEESTRQFPTAFAEIINDMKGLSDEQKSAILTSRVGAKTNQERDVMLSDMLRASDKETMDVVKKTLNMDEDKLKSFKKSVEDQTKPYLSGIKFITSTDRVKLESSINNSIMNKALELRAANSGLTDAEAINRARELVFSNIAVVDEPYASGFVAKEDVVNVEGAFFNNGPSTFPKLHAEFHVSQFKELAAAGKLKVNYNASQDFIKNWGDAEFVKKKDWKEINAKFLDQFEDLMFVNTDITGKSNAFVLYGRKNKFSEPVKIYMMKDDGSTYEYLLPGSAGSKAPKGKVKRNPSSVEQESFHDYQMYMSPNKYNIKAGK